MKAKPYERQRVSLTEMLRNSIKELRKKYNKRGDVLSKELEKSASYISQLENGKIQEIDFSTLMQIFKTIFNQPDKVFLASFSDYIDSLLKRTNKEALVKENWIHTFMIQEIQYPVSGWIIDFIKNKLQELNKTPLDLTQKLNSNHDLHWSALDLLPNKAYTSASFSSDYAVDEKYALYTRIYYKLEDNYVSDILDGTIKTINYINMQGIFRALFRMESIPNPEVLEKAKKILIDNNFLNTFERYDFLQTNNSTTTVIENNEPFIFYDNLVMNYQEKYNSLKTDVFEKLDYALSRYYRANSAYSCETMEKIFKNFDFDAGLILAILSSSIYNIPKSMRSDFMEDYRDLLNRYISYNKK